MVNSKYLGWMYFGSTWMYLIKKVAWFAHVWYYSAECLGNSGLQADSSVCEEDLDFMEQINQELELDTSAESQPEGLIKRSAFFCNVLAYCIMICQSHIIS